MSSRIHALLSIAMLSTLNVTLTGAAFAQSARFDVLAKQPFKQNRPTEKGVETLKDELLFQRATQTYLWATPPLNTMGMRDGFAQSFGTGYNTMAIREKRLDAKTRITTPDSDLIYGMVFVNLADTGPLVFEAPPKLQGILLDMWQRPIPHDGGKFFGDVGLPGPDGGAGGKFLILPPGYSGDVPSGYYVYRSGTNDIFIFRRSFYSGLNNISPAVDVLKASVLYPLGKKDSAEKMKFLDASGKPHEMLPRTDATALQQLKYLVDSEDSHLADPDWLGMLAGLGIVKGEPFEPDARTRKILDAAAKAGDDTSRLIGLQGKSGAADYRVYADRQWVNPVNNLSSRWLNAPLDLGFLATKGGYRDLDARTWFFTDYYSISPESPGAEKESNWLPTPKGEFSLCQCTYRPNPEILQGKWIQPASAKVNWRWQVGEWDTGENRHGVVRRHPVQLTKQDSVQEFLGNA
ncbi:DUF1254 domain-containing protein [Cupriavidus basilensis]